MCRRESVGVFVRVYVYVGVCIGKCDRCVGIGALDRLLRYSDV